MQQLDIFEDSVPVQRANDLISALANFDRAASRQALRHLVDADPPHARLAQYQLLCDFVEHWCDSCDDPDWLENRRIMEIIRHIEAQPIRTMRGWPNISCCAISSSTGATVAMTRIGHPPLQPLPQRSN